MREDLKVACARSVFNTVAAASDKLRGALEKSELTEEIVVLTTAVADLVRALYLQDVAMTSITDIDLLLRAEGGRTDDMP